MITPEEIALIIQALTPVVTALIGAAHAAGTAGLPSPSADAVQAALVAKGNLALNQAWLHSKQPPA